MIEQGGHDDEGYGIAEGQAMIASVRLKNLLSLRSHRVAIGDEMESGLHLGEKGEGGPIAAPVSKQCDRLADDIPSRAKRRADGSGFSGKGVSSRMVAIPGVKASVEE